MRPEAVQFFITQECIEIDLYSPFFENSSENYDFLNPKVLLELIFKGYLEVDMLKTVCTKREIML